MFCFEFWKKVWHFKSTVKYPKTNFIPGYYVGIAWEHGDEFIIQYGLLLIVIEKRARIN